MQLNYAQKKRMFLVFFVIIIALAAYMLRDYLPAIFVGGLLAYFLMPAYRKVLSWVKRPLFAQCIVGFTTILLLLALIALFIFPLVGQAELLYDNADEYVLTFTALLEKCSTSPTPSSWCGFIQKVEIEQIQQKAQEVAGKVGLFITQGALDILKFITSLVLFVIIVSFSLFYFLGSGAEVTQRVASLLPLDEIHKKQILDRFENTIRAVVGGNIITAILQGLLGGIIFFAAGIPFSFIFGLLIAIAALIPLIGSPAVWIPIVLYLLLQGAYLKAGIVALLSFVILGSIDNFLKPKLIGDKIKMSSFAIFLGVLGGISVFGILGIFVGPIILAMLVTCIDIYRELK
ncbi:AI-2E family transporter [Candidatus Woesearchaeota archaeon]|nr:AI-2E family transporter [Candidatus Woesearchaeota archaeon]